MTAVISSSVPIVPRGLTFPVRPFETQAPHQWRNTLFAQAPGIAGASDQVFDITQGDYDGTIQGYTGSEHFWVSTLWGFGRQTTTAGTIEAFVGPTNTTLSGRQPFSMFFVGVADDASNTQFHISLGSDNLIRFTASGGSEFIVNDLSGTDRVSQNTLVAADGDLFIMGGSFDGVTLNSYLSVRGASIVASATAGTGGYTSAFAWNVNRSTCTCLFAQVLTRHIAFGEFEERARDPFRLLRKRPSRGYVVPAAGGAGAVGTGLTRSLKLERLRLVS